MRVQEPQVARGQGPAPNPAGGQQAQNPDATAKLPESPSALQIPKVLQYPTSAPGASVSAGG